MKTKTPDQLQKAALRREKEIAKWEREKARPKTDTYFLYLIFVLTLIYATDEIASQIGTLMKTEIANDLMSSFGDRSVGVDAEELDRNISLKLADKILSPAERARFDAAGNKQLALLSLWVLKEAAVKLTGRGLNGYPNHTDFHPDDPRVTVIDGCLVAVLTEE